APRYWKKPSEELRFKLRDKVHCRRCKSGIEPHRSCRVKLSREIGMRHRVRVQAHKDKSRNRSRSLIDVFFNRDRAIDRAMSALTELFWSDIVIFVHLCDPRTLLVVERVLGRLVRAWCRRLSG